MRAAFVALIAALALPATATAGGPSMLVGAAENLGLQPTLPAAKAQMDLAKMAGLNAIRLAATWARGTTEPDPDSLLRFKNAAAAADLDGIKTVVSLYPYGSSQTPQTADDQRDFITWEKNLAAALPGVTSFIVGNEPNINRFWLPQFDANGGDVAAPNYVQLLALSYDALKSVNPKIQVIGGAVSPRGGDKPGTGRDTHSPTTFIADMGAAFRDSGRPRPIMDAFAFHPYEDNSSQPPTTTHPNTSTIALADYDKLVALLGQAFDGTAQPGSTLPIVYDEFGVEAVIPPAKASQYAGSELSTVHPVDEATQASFYRQAFSIAFCQPNVAGIFLFHVSDEPALSGWQSGVYYANGDPKSSLPLVATAARDSRGGVITRCQGLQLTPKPAAAFPTGAALTKTPLTTILTCDIDCDYQARLERWPTHATVLGARGKAQAGVATRIAFPRPKRKGSYRLTIRVSAPVNAGPPATVASQPFKVL